MVAGASHRSPSSPHIAGFRENSADFRDPFGQLADRHSANTGGRVQVQVPNGFGRDLFGPSGVAGAPVRRFTPTSVPRQSDRDRSGLSRVTIRVGWPLGPLAASRLAGGAN